MIRSIGSRWQGWRFTYAGAAALSAVAAWVGARVAAAHCVSVDLVVVIGCLFVKVALQLKDLDGLSGSRRRKNGRQMGEDIGLRTAPPGAGPCPLRWEWNAAKESLRSSKFLTMPYNLSNGRIDLFRIPRLVGCIHLEQLTNVDIGPRS